MPVATLNNRGMTRRGVLRCSAAALPWAAPLLAAAPRRVGAVAYSYWFSLGLFEYQKRADAAPRMDVFGFLEATRKAGGDAVQIFVTMLDKLDGDGMARLRRRAADLDVRLEIHGGTATAPDFGRVFAMAEALGVSTVGCSFGFLARPARFATLAAWDEHMASCQTHLRGLAVKAKEAGVTLGIENHLDFTVEEMADLIRGADSPHVGVLFDVGNWIGTLDDPVEAARALGKYTVGTHYKDFVVEEVTRGFRFTMVPLGSGSLRLPEITAALQKEVRPEAAYCIEMMNGQQFEVRWLEEQFWPPYRNVTARQLAATLRHIRSKAPDLTEFLPSSELDKLPPAGRRQIEDERITSCIARLRKLLQSSAG